MPPISSLYPNLGCITDESKGTVFLKPASALAGFRNTVPLDSSVIQPRFGYKLDIGGTKLISGMDRVEGAELSGGIGVFSGRVPQVWMTNPAANTGVSTVYFGNWAQLPK